MEYRTRLYKSEKVLYIFRGEKLHQSCVALWPPLLLSLIDIVSKIKLKIPYHPGVQGPDGVNLVVGSFLGVQL